MLNIAKFMEFKNPTVSDLMAYLERLNPNMRISLVNESVFYAHVDDDENLLLLDTDNMEDDYGTF